MIEVIHTDLVKAHLPTVDNGTHRIGAVSIGRLHFVSLAFKDTVVWAGVETFDRPIAVDTTSTQWFAASDTSFIFQGSWHAFCPNVYDRTFVGPTFHDDIRPVTDQDWVHTLAAGTEVLCVKPYRSLYGKFERESVTIPAGETLAIRANTDVVVLTGAVEVDGVVRESPYHFSADAAVQLTAVRNANITTFWFKG